jgi:RND family efflux transporter MFP subunit
MRLLCLVAVPLGLCTAARLAAAGGESGQPTPAPGLTWPEAMARFLKLTPAERLRLIEKSGRGEVTTQKASRRVLRMEIVERGTLEAASYSDVICTMRSATRGSTIASTVKWVIDDGTAAKKGDKLIELGDTGLQDLLKQRQLDLNIAVAARDAAEDKLKLARTENEIDIRLAEIALRLTEGRLKRLKEDDPDLKEELELKVEEARLALKRLKLLARTREAAAQAEVLTHTGRVALERDRKKEIEAELRDCVLRAPQDGMVIYYVPESVRGGGGVQQSVVAQGEPVREGQKLLQVVDLSRMQVNVRVHEALVGHLHNEDPKHRDQWQQAEIRVDAFPSRALKGHVKTVDTVAAQQDWFASDVKVYKTIVAIDAPAEGLKPGMSAEVTIQVQQTPGPVLQVPLQAVVALGKKRYCLVLTDKEVQAREVETGLNNEVAVEIRSGLKEGERVILSPRGLIRRLAPALDRRAGLRARPPVPVVVRSVKPTEESARRSWIAHYGLTYVDRARIAALPTVRQAVPVRSFPEEARRLYRTFHVRLVATTPAYAGVEGLRLAEGRFLTDEDGRHFRNVAVLGAAVADKLFPAQDPLGETIVLGKSLYHVVGVLDEQDANSAGLTAWQANHDIYLPLRTCQVRFGKRVVIRRGASRSAEEVALHSILVAVASPADVAGTVENLREILEQGHPTKDWAVQESPRP